MDEGNAALLKSDFGAAEAAYQRALQIRPGLVAAYSRQAFLYALQPEHWRESLQLAEKAVDLDPGDSEAWSYLSLVRVLNKHYDQLPEAAERAAESGPDSALAHTALAQARLILNEVEEAQIEVEKALELEPDNVMALIVQSAVHKGRGAFDQALITAEQAVALQPDFVFARLALADAHLAIQEFDEALAELEEIQALTPDYIPAVLKLVELNADRKQMDEALIQMRLAEDLAFDVPEVLRARGWLHLRRETERQALRPLQHAVSLDQVYWPAYLLLGLAYERSGECEKAVTNFRQALDLYPGSGAAHAGMAMSLECTGEFARAEEGYRKAAELAPFDGFVQWQKALQLLQTEDYDASLEAMRTTLMQNTDSPEIYVMLGQTHLLATADQDAAEGSFRHALALDADNLEAVLGLGSIHLDKEEYERAAEAYERALRIDNQSADAHYGLGLAQTMRQEYDGALVHLERSLDLGLEQTDAYLYLGRAFREQDELRRAGEAFEAYLELAPEPFAGDAVRSAATDLIQGEYWLTEEEASDTVRVAMEEITRLAGEVFPFTLFSADLNGAQEARAFTIVLDLETDEYDDETLLLGTFIAFGFGAGAVVRVQPPSSGRCRGRVAKHGRIGTCRSERSVADSPGLDGWLDHGRLRIIPRNPGARPASSSSTSLLCRRAKGDRPHCGERARSGRAGGGRISVYDAGRTARSRRGAIRRRT